MAELDGMLLLIGILMLLVLHRNLEFTIVQSLSCETNLSPIFHFFQTLPTSFSSELVRTHPFKLSENPAR